MSRLLSYDKHCIGSTEQSSMLNVTLILVLSIFFQSYFSVKIGIEQHASTIPFEATKSSFSFITTMMNVTFKLSEILFLTTFYQIFNSETFHLQKLLPICTSWTIFGFLQFSSREARLFLLSYFGEDLNHRLSSERNYL